MKWPLVLAVVGVALAVPAGCADDDEPGEDAGTTSSSAVVSTTTSDLPVVREPVITVDPAEDLVDGDVVSVSASGFADADVVVIGQCLAVDPLTFEDCEPAVEEGDEGRFVKADGGSIDAPFRVSAAFATLGGEVVDCRARESGCLVVVSSLLTRSGEDRLTGFTVPIGFDPDGALSPPGVAVDPTSELVDGQALSVSVWGLEPGFPVFVAECVLGAVDGGASCEIGSQAPRFTADASGRVEGTYWAQVEFETDDGITASCREPGACVLQIGHPEGEGFVETDVPISFDPSTPLAEPPQLTVEPATGLVDGEAVSATGAGFFGSDLRQVRIVQCAGDVEVSACDFAGLQEAWLDEGSLQTEVTVRAIVYTGDGRTVDCRSADAECVLAVTTDRGVAPVRWGIAELAFDPDAALAPPPELTIIEGDTFVDLSYVSLAGAGFAPGIPVSVFQCPVRAADTGACGEGLYRDPVADEGGRFEASVPVSAATENAAGEEFSCDAPGRCELVALPQPEGGVGPILAGRSAAVPVTVTEAPREIRYLHRVFDDVETLGPFVYGTGTDKGTPVELSLTVHAPADDTATDRPVILFGNPDEFVPRGFVVVWPDIPEVEASRVSIEQAYDNALPALAWLSDNADELGIDPDRIAAMGHSRGGFIATSLAYGPVAAEGEASGLGAAVSMAGGALPDLIEAGEPPTLYFHGDQDTRAPFALVQEACAAAEAVEVGCELVVYEDRGHVEVNDGFGDLRFDIVDKTAQYLIDLFDLNTQ